MGAANTKSSPSSSSAAKKAHRRALREKRKTHNGGVSLYNNNVAGIGGGPGGPGVAGGGGGILGEDFGGGGDESFVRKGRGYDSGVNEAEVDGRREEKRREEKRREEKKDEERGWICLAQRRAVKRLEPQSTKDGYEREGEKTGKSTWKESIIACISRYQAKAIGGPYQTGRSAP
ncbi:hypothetical protein SVAN01_10321 [Stagonosporopsis vannaccii]|nr:hypothetical protein SVAN01_10321 [Stagonosporopsis vannaccii]